MSEIKIEMLPPQGMVSLRCDFSKAPFSIPETRKFADGVAWMSPDELLFIGDYDQAESKRAELSETLKDQHHLAVNLSDARAMFRLTGPNAREVLAKDAPVDLSPDAFKIGDLRRTHIGQVAAMFWMSDADVFDLVCFRSVAGHMNDWLEMAARDNSLPHYF